MQLDAHFERPRFCGGRHRPDTDGPDTHGPDTHGPDTHGPDTHGPDTHARPLTSTSGFALLAAHDKEHKLEFILNPHHSARHGSDFETIVSLAEPKLPIGPQASVT